MHQHLRKEIRLGIARRGARVAKLGFQFYPILAEGRFEEKNTRQHVQRLMILLYTRIEILA